MKSILPHKSARGAMVDEVTLIDAIFERSFFTSVTYSGASPAGVEKTKFITFPHFKNFFVQFMRSLHEIYTDDHYKDLIQKRLAKCFCCWLPLADFNFFYFRSSV